jgi:hypothetical protein
MTNDEATCNLSATDLEMIADGEKVGPWLLDGKAVYVQLDYQEDQKIDAVLTKQ